MRPWFLTFSLLYFPLAALLADSARAEALAPAGAADNCVAADVNPLRPLDNGQVLYQIVFVNRCNLPRRFFWCAEHASPQVPAAIACRSLRGLGTESRHAIRHRKEFQWNLPAGVQIRFHDCPTQENPTADFSCAPLANATRR